MFLQSARMEIIILLKIIQLPKVSFLYSIAITSRAVESGFKIRFTSPIRHSYLSFTLLPSSVKLSKRSLMMFYHSLKRNKFVLNRTSFETVRIAAYNRAALKQSLFPRKLRRLLAKTTIHRAWLQGHTGSFLVSVLERNDN